MAEKLFPQAEMDESEEALLSKARRACPLLSKALDLPGYKILGHPYLFMLLYAVVDEDPIAAHDLDLIFMAQEGSCCTNGRESFEGWCADCLACACEEWLCRKWEARNG